jgi:hypothetical protein
LTPPAVPAILGARAIKAYLRRRPSQDEGGRVDDQERDDHGVDVSGDLGGSAATIRSSTGRAAVDSGNYLSVHKLTNGQWLYVRDIWNSDRPPAPAK